MGAEDDALGARSKDMDGRVLVAGDRVEAKYKGRGSKFFAGRVSAVRVVDGLPAFNLLYDDGDKEEGARPENVRRVGPSKADASPSRLSVSFSDERGLGLELARSPFRVSSAAVPLHGAVPSFVDSNDVGKTSEVGPRSPWVVRADPTFELEDDIEVDSDLCAVGKRGDALIGVAPSDSKAVTATSSVATVSVPGLQPHPTAGPAVAPGARFLALGSRSNAWLPATITRVTSDGLVSLRFDNGDFDFGVAPSRLASLEG